MFVLDVGGGERVNALYRWVIVAQDADYVKREVVRVTHAVDVSNDAMHMGFPNRRELFRWKMIPVGCFLQSCHRGSYAVFLLVILLSCSYQKDPEGEQPNPGVLHPTEENIPEITDSRFVFHEKISVEAKSFLDISGGNGHMIGIMEGSSAEMIGDIADVTISKERLYYADSEYSEVRIYDQLGSLMGTVGSPGAGPGEFQQITNLSVTGDGEILAVLDQGTRVQVFRQRDSRYMLEHTFRVPDSFYGGDICVMDDHVYTLGLSVPEELNGIIHKYTISGEYVTSFGEIYKTSFELLRRMLAPEGSLECNEEHGVVGHVNDNIPVLSGYTDTGSLLWQVKFADLNPTKIEEGVTSEGAPSVTRPAPKKGDSGGIQLFSNTEDTFLFTYDTVSDFDSLTEIPSGTRHYFIVDVLTGQGSYLGQNPNIDFFEYPILIALDAEHAYTMVFSPFPHFGIYQRREVLP